MEEKKKFIIGGLNNWYDHYVAVDIELLNAYIEQCEISSSAAVADFHKHKEEEIIKNETDNYGGVEYTIHFRGIDGNTFNAKEIYQNEFPNMNRQSTLVIIMALFEKRLKQLCDWVHDDFNLKNKFVRDNNSSLLQSIKKYLETEAEIKFSKYLNLLWSDLRTLQTIRNNITHNYGTYKKDNEYVDAYIKNNKNIYIAEDDGTILLNRLFLTDLIPFFNELCKELQSAIRNREKK